jgi:hypothetical protein
VAGVKYQVFVSSTYEDLRAERDQVIRAVLEMGHIPVGMEMFSAADEEQWQIISRHIDESDYYVVIIAHRYGSVTSEGTSYTRKEYEYARSKGIPCLGFVIDPSASWPADRVDTKEVDKKLLDDFKDRLRERPVSTWSSADDLHGKFSIALMKAFTAQPRIGWVRASEVGGPELTAQLVRLSSENSELRERVTAAEKAAATEYEEALRLTMRTLFANRRSPSYRYTANGPWHKDAETDLFMVFVYLGPELLVEASTSALAGTLAMNIRQDRDRQQWDIVASNQMKTILADLVTLDIVQPSPRKHTVSDTNAYWTLTQFGIDLLKRVRKVTLKEKEEDDAPDDVPTETAASPSPDDPESGTG